VENPGICKNTVKKRAPAAARPGPSAHTGRYIATARAFPQGAMPAGKIIFLVFALLPAPQRGDNFLRMLAGTLSA
jgi:hypothetical protein